VSRKPGSIHIESLISEQQAAQKDLEEAREQLSAQMAQVESMRDKVREFERTRSDDPDAIARWNERLQEWEKVLAYNVDLFKRAKADVVAFAKIVEQAEMEWSMATADAKIAASFGRKSGDFLRTLRERTALDAVQKASAESRARLRLSVVDHDHVVDQTRDKPAVHAINYTATGKVDLGRVLDLAEINLPSPPPNSAIQ
jgi:DNA repair ATPase RecN